MVNSRFEDLSRTRQQAWLSALHVNDVPDTDLKNMRVCSDHFFSGKSADLQDSLNPDWIPTVNMSNNDNYSSSVDDGL
jgi:hypothetical protein